jgi:hypothetical protein
LRVVSNLTSDRSVGGSLSESPCQGSTASPAIRHLTEGTELCVPSAVEELLPLVIVED